MVDFPRLSTGAVAQYPSSVRAESSTRVLRYLDGSEQRYRDVGAPVRTWVLRLDQITEEELAAVEEFFVAQQGQFGQFSFTDPWDGTEYPDCSFDSDSLHAQLFSEEWAGTTLIIRANRTS